MMVAMDAVRLQQLAEWTEVGPWRVEFRGAWWVLWSNHQALVMVPEASVPSVRATDKDDVLPPATCRSCAGCGHHVERVRKVHRVAELLRVGLVAKPCKACGGTGRKPVEQERADG